VPTWISKDGEWSPAKEKVALVNRSDKSRTINGKRVQPGDPYIYEGPDRAALYELFKTKQEKLGLNFKTDPEFINRVRQLGFTMDDYLKFVGYNPEEVEENFKKHAATVNKHEIKEKVKAIDVLGGGIDTSGMNPNRYGGFGEPTE